MSKYTTRDEPITLGGKQYKPWTAVDVEDDDDVEQWEMAAAQGLACRIHEETTVTMVAEVQPEPEKTPRKRRSRRKKRVTENVT